MREDYCQHCGCPKDICCGQGKVSLEWLEEYCEAHETLRDCVDRNEIMKAARKQAGDGK